MHSRTGLDTDNLDIRIAFLEITANTGDRSTGAKGGEEIVDVSCRLVPDFRSGRAVMRFDIEFVFVLVRADVLAFECNALDQAFHYTTSTFGWKERAHLILDFQQFRAKEAQQDFLFLGRAVGYCQFDGYALCVSQCGQRDPGVASRWFGQHLALFELKSP